MKQGELEYYRAVEDHFARLRGTPFLLSPKDFGLMRTWWQDDVPLAAVFAGLNEVAERRRGRGEGPISSLSYCRHAVARHARRLAEANVGGAPGDIEEIDVAASLRRSVEALRAAAQRWADQTEVRSALEALADSVEGLPETASPAAVDETLSRLETGFLESLLGGLSGPLRERVEAEVDEGMEGLDAAPEVVERTRRALSFRALRTALGLPRLELSGG